MILKWNFNKLLLIPHLTTLHFSTPSTDRSFFFSIQCTQTSLWITVTPTTIKLSKNPSPLIYFRRSYNFLNNAVSFSVYLNTGKLPKGPKSAGERRKGKVYVGAAIGVGARIKGPLTKPWLQAKRFRLVRDRKSAGKRCPAIGRCRCKSPAKNIILVRVALAWNRGSFTRRVYRCDPDTRGLKKKHQLGFYCSQ